VILRFPRYLEELSLIQHLLEALEEELLCIEVYLFHLVVPDDAGHLMARIAGAGASVAGGPWGVRRVEVVSETDMRAHKGHEVCVGHRLLMIELLEE